MTGDKAAHGLAVQRGEYVIAIVPRMPLRVADGWGNTTVNVPEGSWRNRLTGEPVGSGQLRLSSVFAKFPVALLVKESANA